MKIILKSTNFSLTPSINEYVNSALTPLDRLFQGLGEVEMRVEVGRSTFHHNKGEVFFAEANVNIGKNLLRARAESFSVQAALDEVRDELRSGVLKFKGKKETVFRRGARSISKFLRLSPLARFREFKFRKK
ncbi:MAG: ribosome-associated translation inhibitor RaiA [bacterium]|nr:ribosome-associated translation inhibitor RaiA [bacterium]